jgi:hypothetical protein
MKKQRECVQADHDSAAGIVVQRDDAMLRLRRFDGCDPNCGSGFWANALANAFMKKAASRDRRISTPFNAENTCLSLLSRIIRECSAISGFTRLADPEKWGYDIAVALKCRSRSDSRLVSRGGTGTYSSKLDASLLAGKRHSARLDAMAIASHTATWIGLLFSMRPPRLGYKTLIRPRKIPAMGSIFLLTFPFIERG